MEDIRLFYLPLPCTVKGLTVQDEEGNYNIYLNTRHTYETHTETLQHELDHISNKDFQNSSHIKDIEK